MATIDALIFDVDGTLADTEELHRSTFNTAFAELQLGWHWSREAYRPLLDVAGGKERLAHFVRQTLNGAQQPALLARVAEIHDLKTAHYTAAVGSLVLRPGLRRLVEQARAAGCRLAVASATLPANVQALLQAHGLEGFSVIACGDDVPAKKPAPDVYLRALQLLGLPASRCVAFEDSSNGLRAATAAGLRCVVMPTFWTADHDLDDATLLLPADGEWPSLEQLRHLPQRSTCATP